MIRAPSPSDDLFERAAILDKIVPDRCCGCPLRGAALCRAVAGTKDPGVRPAHTLRFKRDETIINQGHDQGFLGVIRKGYLRRERLSCDGRRTVLDLALPGDTVWQLPGGPYMWSLEAATDAEICAFDAQTVRRMMTGNVQFRMHLLQEAIYQQANQQELIWRRGALTARERIMAFLVMATEIMPVEPLPDGSLIVTIKLSRKDWAALSNTTVETISRVMQQLAEKKLVMQPAPGRYRIRDLDALIKLAGMDPDADHGRLRHSQTTQPFGSKLSAARLTAINAAKSPRSILKRVQSISRPSAASA